MVSLHPIRQDVHLTVRLGGVVGDQVQAEVVPAAHVAVHIELHFQARALARLEDRRTDGRDGRSTPLDDFDVRLLGQLKSLVADVGQHE